MQIHSYKDFQQLLEQQEEEKQFVGIGDCDFLDTQEQHQESEEILLAQEPESKELTDSDVKRIIAMSRVKRREKINKNKIVEPPEFEVTTLEDIESVSFLAAHQRERMKDVA